MPSSHHFYHLVSLCASVTFVASQYFSSEQTRQVAQWEAYIEHNSQLGRYHDNDAVQPIPPGRSFSHRADWSGQQLPRAHERESHWPEETGSTPLSEPVHHRPGYTHPPRTEPVYYQYQPFEPKISPDPSYWVHSSQHVPRTRVQTATHAQIFTRPTENSLKNTNHYHNTPIQSQSSSIGEENYQIRPTNREIYQDVVLPKRNRVHHRNTQESYHGFDNVPEQSIVDQQYVTVQSLRQPVESFEEGLIKRIKSLRGTEIFPEQYSFFEPYRFKGVANIGGLPSINGLIYQPPFIEQQSSRSNIRKPTVHETSTFLPEEKSGNVSPSHYATFTERTHFIDEFQSTNRDSDSYTVYPDELTGSRLPVNNLPSLPVTNVQNFNRKTIQNQVGSYSEDFLNSNGISKKLNAQLSALLNERTDFDLKSQLVQTDPPFVSRKNYAHEASALQENGDKHIEGLPQPEDLWESCEGPEGHPGHCVPAELCDLEGSLHYYSTSQRHFCIIKRKQSIGICCLKRKKEEAHVEVTVHVAASPQLQLPTQDLGHDLHHDPHHDPHDDLHHEHCIYPIADYKVCGRGGKMMSNVTTSGPATSRDWPWSVVLIRRSDLRQFCGGTLITRRHVLTAAHCFRTRDPNSTLVVLGDYDVVQLDESPSRVFAVERLISNDDYDPATHESDIALLVLNDTTVYNDYIQPACLPVPGPRYANQTAVLTGWGVTQYRGELPTNLMETPLPVWDQEMCIPRYTQTIFNTSMCAGAFQGGRDSCQGDSGGPLLKQCHHTQRWVIIGIVSWGIRCAERDKPGVYTRVNEYLEWIHENILENSTETNNVTNTILPVHHFLK